MAFGMMFVGCDASTIIIGGGLVLGGVIGGALGSIFIGVIVGGIIGFIVFMLIMSGTSNSSSSITTHMDNRNKYPNKCISCTKYLSRGECRLTGNRVSEMDSCSSWC